MTQLFVFFHEYFPSLILPRLIIPQAGPALESDKGWASPAYKTAQAEYHAIHDGADRLS